jgi:lipoprotein-releasing system permease protein
VDGKKVSKPIVKLSIISISLAVIVNLITVAVVIGFKNEVSNKVLGFGSHAYVRSSNSSSLFENEPILKKQNFIEIVQNLPFIKNIQAVAYKPAILQSDKSNTNTQEIQSVLVKGVDEKYDFTFFKEYLIAGRLPKLNKSNRCDEILISKKIAQDLHFKVGNQAKAFFVKNQPVKKVFQIVGIFDTGMEEFDKKMVVADIKHLQQLNDWGIQASIQILDTLYNGQLVIKADVQGGNGNYRYDWGKGYNRFSGFTWFPNKDTVIRLIASDYWMFLDGKGEHTSIPDTAFMIIRSKVLNGPLKLNRDGTLFKNYLDKEGYQYELKSGDKSIFVSKKDGIGSFSEYIGAYELNFYSWVNFEDNISKLKKTINYAFSNDEQSIEVSSIKEHEQDIFIWLSFLDINVWIIITLMLIIGVINMGSALLVMILIRTSFIGIMKAMGASNWMIRKIFLIQVFFLILKGLFWGNMIGIGLALIQKYTGLVSLNPDVYYLSQVPIELSFWSIILINFLTIFVCVTAMIIPSLVISKIKPSQSIRFN